jgi:hypothetical protein
MADDNLSTFEEVVSILLAPAQDLENTMIAVRDENVDTAVGARLDVYGRKVGLRRDASPLFSPIVTADDPFRRAIRAWIQALCANVTETAPRVEITVEGEQEFGHDAEHVQEERCLLAARGDSLRGSGGGTLGGSGESHLPRAPEAPELHG